MDKRKRAQLAYSNEWPVHLKVTSEEAVRTDRPRESLHEIYDIAIALDTGDYALDRSRRTVRQLAAGLRPGEESLPSPCLYVSAGFPCHTILVFDQSGCHIADVSLSLHSTVHIAGVPATSEALLQRYHIGRVHIHQRILYVADCEFDLVYVCDLAGDVRHVISWPEELYAPMGMAAVGAPPTGRLYVCDSNHRRVRVYNLTDYRPVPGEDSPGLFAGVHTRGVCQCAGQRLVAGDFDSPTGRLLVLDGDGQQPREIPCPGLGEPFAIVPGPLPDTVFVSASSSQGDHAIRLLDVGPTVAVVAGAEECGSSRVLLATCGGAGTGPGQFSKPRGLAVDPAARRLYAVDARNYRVQVFTYEVTDG